VCPGEVQVSNRNPSGVISWNTLSPSNETNLTGRVLVSDGDADTVNVTYDIFKNGVLTNSGSVNNIASPYVNTNIFTIDSSTTQVGDNYTFNVSITDGIDNFASPDSDTATVIGFDNFTISLTNFYSGNDINNYYFYIGDPTFTTVNYISNPSCGLFEGCIDYTFIDLAYLDGNLVNNDYIYNSTTIRLTSVSRIPSGDTIFYYVYPNNTRGPYAYGSTGGFFPPNVTTINATFANETTFVTGVVSNETSNITILANNYYTKTYSDWNLSTNLFAEITPYYYAVNASFDGNITVSGNDYFRNSVITLNYVCNNKGETIISLYEDSSLYNTINANCQNENLSSTNFTYNANTEGSTTLKAYLNNTLNAVTSSNEFFSINIIRDINPPKITSLNFTSNSGFSFYDVEPNAICTDTIMPTLNYYIDFNGANVYNANVSSGTNYNTAQTPVYGLNTINFTCSDHFSTDNDFFSQNVYRTSISLIDEQENTLFSVGNLTGARAYFADNSTFYDFKSTSTNQVDFTGFDLSQLRFEFIYSSGTIINRWIDVSLFDEDDLRVCVFKDNNIQAYQQLIASTSQQPTGVKNVFSNCYVALDYTRFAFQNSQVLNAYTINALYYLYRYDNNELVYLASIDGSQESSINLDVLEFSDQSYSIDLLSPALSLEKLNNQTIIVRYDDDRTNVDSGTLTITNLDTNTDVFSIDLTNPNSFTVYYDFSTLNVNDTTLFKVSVASTLESGTVDTTSRYFNTSGRTGSMTSQLALVFSLLLTVFGITFTRASLGLGWLGLIVMIFSIIIAGMAVPTMALNLLIGMNIVIMLYIIVTMFSGSNEVEVLR